MERRRGSIALLAAFLAAVFACGGEERREPAAEETGEEVPIPGMYKVEGATVDKASGERRDISGTVILAVSGDEYTATFHLATTFPGSGTDPIAAEVIGKGEGKVQGRTLTGTAHTQLVVASVPGVDPNFAFIPRQVSTRLISDSVTTIARNGSVVIQTESRGEEGEHYSPTKTILKGQRIAAAPLDKTGGAPTAKTSPSPQR
jgi:hypothetical protein